MKKLLLITTILLSGLLTAQAQTVYTGDITFTSQAQIDAFIFTYPNCTEIDGNVTVEGVDINNFFGFRKIDTITGDLIIQNNPALVIPSWLDNLKFIGGNLKIISNTSLVSLEGLSGLKKIGGDLEIKQNPVLTGFKGNGAAPALGVLATIGRHITIAENSNLESLTGLETVSSLGGNFYIRFNTELISLVKFNKLTTIGGYLWIDGNYKLKNLNGLEILTSIGGGINIASNDLLENLAELTNIKSINGYLHIFNNNLLTDITGIRNIDASTIKDQTGSNYDLTIELNPQLSKCAVQSVCSVLDDGSKTIKIANNKAGCNNVTEVQNACLTTYTGDITFTSQAQIYAFIFTYPNCTEIDGNVTVEGADINNFLGLLKIDAITGSLIIQNNPALVIPSWLDNLKFIGGSLSVYGNQKLESLEGLSGLQTVNGNMGLSSNPKLTGLIGNGAKPALGELTYIGGNLGIVVNKSLNSISGLNAVTRVEGDLYIHDNAILKECSGFNSLKEIGGNFYITNNPALNNLSGFKALTDVGLSVYIFENSSLENFSGLEKLTSVGGYLAIYNNDALINFSGLNNLKKIGGDLEIVNNLSLISLTGLENLNSTGKYVMPSQVDLCLKISGNPKLADINGLEGLTSIVGCIVIDNNNVLTDISGIRNIDPATVKSSGSYQDLNIFNNPQLSECAVKSVCELLNDGSKTTDIHDNKEGCNSAAEVEHACSPPACTHLTNPVNGAVDVEITTDIAWAPSANADGYLLQVGTSHGGSELLNIDVGNVTTWNPPETFECDQDVYVTIHPYNSNPLPIACTEEIFHTEKVTATVSADVSVCLNSSVQLQASGGSEYIWTPTTGLNDPNIPNPIASPTATTTYTVIVKNANGCLDTDEIKVTVRPLPVPNAVVTDETGNGFKDGTATCTPTGASPFTYAWSNGENTQTISGLSPGSYTVTVTDINGCTANQTVSVSAFGCPSLSINSNLTNVSCNGACDGAVSVTGITNGTAPYTYAWSNGQTTQNATGLCAGDYSVTITDAKNCSVTSETFTITEPEALVLSVSTTDETGNNFQDGTATIHPDGGTMPYSYHWPWGGTSQSYDNLRAGDYTMTVTDANQCSAEISFTINAFICPDLAVVENLDNVNCHGSCDGEITITGVTNGVSPYTYSWSNGQTSQTVTGLCAGDFYVKITDAKKCSVTSETYTVTEPEALVLSVTTTDETSNGAKDGTATCTPTGASPFAYTWSNGKNTKSISGLAPGNYTVTVTDANGCTADQTISVSAFGCQTLSISSNLTNVSCNGACDGAVSVTGVTNGTAPYTYAWSNGQTTQNATGLCAGDYSVTITDANGCSVVSETFSITQPPEIIIGDIIKTNISESVNKGSIQVSVSGGSSPYSFNWTGQNAFSSNLQNLSDLAKGCYSLTVTDANNCTVTSDSVCIDDLTTDILSIEQMLNLTLYPNPANNRLYLKYNKDAVSGYDNLKIEILSVSGRKVMTRISISNEIDISNLAEGLYFINIKTNDEIVRRKFVIVR